VRGVSMMLMQSLLFADLRWLYEVLLGPGRGEEGSSGPKVAAYWN
jgi:hypothetical protein